MIASRRSAAEDGAMLFIIPLTVIPLIVYNLIAFIWGYGVWDSQLISLTMMSGQPWVFKLGDLMIIFGIGCLFFEVLKSTSSSSRAITNHTLSTVVFIIYLIEFIVVGIAAHSVFFILMIFALFDVVAGFTITIKAATRDVSYNRTPETLP
jgi:hypothetical protein